MHQIIQDLKSGETLLEEVPLPQVGPAEVLIKTHRSLVCPGAEERLVSFAHASLPGKVRQKPEKVKKIIEKMQTDGVRPTLEEVFRKMDTPLPLGYSQAGEVIAVGKGVTEFREGDRVVSNGPHAEVVVAGKNLVAGIPEGVSWEEATFAVVGAIGLQGIRLINPTFGETVVVTGLDLTGLISAQLLMAGGCHVLGLDEDEAKLDKARSFGVTAANSESQEPVAFVKEQTDGIGADAVLVTASTTSNVVIRQAANMSRKRGRIVMVGEGGLDIDRADFYEKELSFQVSCSYGPGRYDEEYEQKGNDYPLPYVRWTEKRNFEAVLEAIARGRLDVQSLITERVKLEDYLEIYGDMENNDSIASILEYPVDGNTEGAEGSTESTEKGVGNTEVTEIGTEERVNGRTISIPGAKIEGGKGTMAVVGAGNFTRGTIMPALKKAGASVKYIVSSGGLSSTIQAKKFGAAHSTTDFDVVLEDKEVDGVIISTRHNLHAGMTLQVLRAGKQVFVEKPLAIKPRELDEIIGAVEETGNTVTVGFNRRFSPHAFRMKELLGEPAGPMNIVATMNAGQVPADEWIHNPEIGGGRIIGEACHYVDLMSWLTGSKVTRVCMQAMGKNPKVNTDNASILLKYANGSQAVINYFANGNKSYAKERVEVYHQGRTLILDNFRKLYGYGYEKKKFNLSNTLLRTRQDKGHKKQFQLLTQRWREGGEPLISFGEIVNTTRATFAAIESLKKGTWIEL